MAEDGGIGNTLNVRPLEERDLAEGQRIVRRAFGTFLGFADLDNFWTDFDYVYGRVGCEHTAAFAADHDGALAGVNFATNWGSVGFFGPLSATSFSVRYCPARPHRSHSTRSIVSFAAMSPSGI